MDDLQMMMMSDLQERMESPEVEQRVYPEKLPSKKERILFQAPFLQGLCQTLGG